MVVSRKHLALYLYYHTLIPIPADMIMLRDQLELSLTIKSRMHSIISEALYLLIVYDYVKIICNRNELNQPLFMRGIIKQMPISICLN